MRNDCVVHLSRRTDYAFRLLILLAVDQERTSSVADAARRLHLSSHHLAKIVQELARTGVVETLRGRSGGVRLTDEGLDTPIGDIVRALEPLDLVECFDRRDNACRLTPGCGLSRILEAGLDAFLAELDAHTLRDLCPRPVRLRRILA